VVRGGKGKKKAALRVILEKSKSRLAAVFPGEKKKKGRERKGKSTGGNKGEKKEKKTGN